jgi:hypothetical protein
MAEKKNILLIELDVPTRSGKTYPAAAVAKALVDYQVVINTGKAIGCFVDDINLQNSTIELRNITHYITRAEIIGNNFVGDIKTTNTVKGKLLDAYLNRADLHFDVRGMGSVSSTGIVSNFSIVTIGAYIDASFQSKTLSKSSDAISDYERAMGIVKR